jgi:hypothetical protein
VFGFPINGAAAFHLTAVVAAPDAADAPPAPPRVDAAVATPAASRAVDVEAGGAALDFYGQDTTHSTRDYFPPGSPVMINPFFRAS